MFVRQFNRYFLHKLPHSGDCLALKSLLSASVTEGNVVVVQQPNGGEPLQFPSVWLRDNCQCSACFHANTKSRQANWKRASVESRIRSINGGAEKDVLTIDWQDNHKSTFRLDWLQDRDFAPTNRKRYIEEVYKPTYQLWGKSEFSNVLRSFEFKDVMQQEEVLLAWLESLAIQGFSRIKNSPHDLTVARQLADRIGYIKRTTYGEEFEVKSKDNARNYAYLMTPLPLHTDMPYYEYKAGINILHCYVQSQSQGGSNLMTDGFYIAEKLRKEFPKLFEILVKTPVDWYDIGKDGGMSFHNIWRAPTICLDVDGRYHRINENSTKRDSHFTVPLEQVAPWYEAYDKFIELAYAEAVNFKTNPGDVFVFNNLRMLHGRTAYEDSPTNKRHLIGAYVDWDIIYSKIRIIRAKYSTKC
ncbi:gamma-butyrobetaine dioxygenase isoform X1 [Zeugodacus cucurbitae]|uniref:gamma-butyrobetaine dioxygenase isoform X1 n=1 Tax=Zeugodacus cucurbitae TaxID=28588 RepID=UPI00059679E3|nr:gamma-butyrobetaine dioxygenase isoform X1 [Zeugodacus cucurbitae]